MAPLSTGLELILNACEGCLQIGLTDDEKPLCFQEWFCQGKATEILAPALAEIFELARISPRSLRRIACVNGPGSATGVRLVLATAAAMRRVNGARVAALDYLQALATSAAIRLLLPYGKKIYVLTHARRNLAHFQAFLSYGPQIPAQPIAEAELINPGEAKKRIEAGYVILCGGALKMYAALFEAVLTGEGPPNLPQALALPDLINPSFEALCLLARHGDYFARDPEPKYISCDAIENLDDIAARRGEDGAKARQNLEKLLARTPDADAG